MSREFSSRKLFQQLDGQVFSSYRDLERQAGELFSSHVESFPGQYSLRRLLELGERKKWIVQLSSGQFRVQFKKDRIQFKQQSAQPSAMDG